MPAARVSPEPTTSIPPTKKTREEIEQAEYETLTDDQRRHVDSLTGSERSAAIQMYRSDRIIQKKNERDKDQRTEKTNSAMARIMGGSATT